MEENKRAAAYSMLMAMYEKEDDFHSLTDCFVPLVLQAFPSDAQATMTELRSNMNSIYPMPELALGYILNRSIETNHVQYDKTEQLYRITPETLNHFMDSTKDVEKRIREAVADVYSYFIANGYVPAPDKNTLAIIISFIERSSLLLRLQASAIKNLAHITVETKEDRLLVKYLENKLEDSIPDAHLQTIMEMAKGAIIAEAITWTDFRNVNLGHFKKCKIFIDTNVIFSLYELHSDNEYKASLELIDLLKLFNFELYIFDFTMQQIKSVLANFSPKKTKGASKDSLWGKLKSKAEAIAKAEEIEKTIHDTMGIKIYKSDIVIERGTVPDNSEIQDKVKIYGSDFQQRKDYPEESLAFGKIHDFAAICEVKSIRDNDSTEEEVSIYNPKSIFLTSDRKLADFNRLDMHSDSMTIPEVMLDTQIAGALWFLGRDRNKLSLNTILAAYSRNLLIDEEIWEKSSDILEKVLTQRGTNIKELPNIFYLDFQSTLSNCKSEDNITIDLVNDRINTAYNIQNNIVKEKTELENKLSQERADHEEEIRKQRELHEEEIQKIEDEMKHLQDELNRRVDNSEAKRRKDRTRLWIIVSIIIFVIVFILFKLNGE